MCLSTCPGESSDPHWGRRSSLGPRKAPPGAASRRSKAESRVHAVRAVLQEAQCQPTCPSSTLTMPTPLGWGRALTRQCSLARIPRRGPRSTCTESGRPQNQMHEKNRKDGTLMLGLINRSPCPVTQLARRWESSHVGFVTLHLSSSRPGRSSFLCPCP